MHERNPAHHHDASPHSAARSAQELRAGLEHRAVGHATRADALARQKIGELLLHERLVTEQHLLEALSAQKLRPGTKIGQILVEAGVITEEELHATLAQLLGVPYVKLAQFDVEPAAVAMLKQSIARRVRVIPLILHREQLVVATHSPKDPETLDLLRFVADRPVLAALAIPRDIDRALNRIYSRVDHAQAIEQITARTLEVDAAADSGLANSIAAAANEEPLIKLVNDMLGEAIQRRVSDIHLRPAEDHIDLVYRIDGSLVGVAEFPKSIHASLLGRMKIIGNMDISEHRMPQDGQIRFRSGDSIVEMRVSILPTVAGESVCIRVLNSQAGLKPISELGFSDRDLQSLTELLEKSFGLILVTGPTGSGKSTTLYSCLSELVRRNLNIITVEDPVEYHLPGIEQVQVRSEIGFTFAAGLRQILRHDPDAILIGEIRDRETAEIVIKSALTGHIVLSTLHANSAVGSITRLSDIGVLPYLISSTLLGSQAQRLVRTNCLHCMDEERVDPHIRRVMGVGPGELFMKGRGCQECNETGFKGRTAAYELLRMTPAMQEKITEGASAAALHRQALDDGMVPLTQHAVDLARRYKTSLSEAYRVRLE